MMENKDTSTKDNTSVIKLYSLGVAAANIEFGQRELEVSPIEDLSQLDGEITDAQDSLESSGKDMDGNTYSSSQKTSNSIKATWLPLDPYRPFPGLIRRGERVLIWRVGDTDKYYWTEMGLDHSVRRTDIFTLLVANSPKEGEDSSTHETAYLLEINTVDKHITIQTNKNDEEKFAYCFQINSDGGNVSICDDAGTLIRLTSKTKGISLSNSMGSEIWIKEKDAGIKVKGNLTLDADDISVKSKSNTTLTNKKLSIKNSTTEITSSSNITIKATGVEWTTAMFKVNGVEIGPTHVHFSGSPYTGPVKP